MVSNQTTSRALVCSSSGTLSGPIPKHWSPSMQESVARKLRYDMTSRIDHGSSVLEVSYPSYDIRAE